MRKLLMILLLLMSVSLYAGDVATFVNLGFSEDGNIFFFGQYGTLIAENKTYADGYIVDCAKNDFIKDGVLTTSNEGLPLLGADGIGTLFNLVAKNNAILTKNKIDHSNNGKTIYFLGEGDEIKNKLDFRVFDAATGIKNVACELKETVTTAEDKSVSSKFHIDLKLTQKDGKVKESVIGYPDFVRKDVAGYYIKNILISADYKNLVFVIAKKIKDDSGISIRYMVETIRIK